MTPRQFAAAECSNFSSDNCLGIDIHDDLALAQAKFSPRQCALPDQRCRYFETVVAPLAEIQRDDRKKKAYEALDREAERMTGGLNHGKK